MWLLRVPAEFSPISRLPVLFFTSPGANPAALAKPYMLLSLHQDLLTHVLSTLPPPTLVALARTCQFLHPAIEEVLRRRAGEWLPVSLPAGEPSWTTLLLWLEQRRTTPRQTLAGGYDHSVFVNRRGQVLACGHAEGGVATWRAPTAVTLAVRIHSVSAGSGFTLALGWLGAVFSWGRCRHGSLVTTSHYHPNPSSLGRLLNSPLLTTNPGPRRAGKAADTQDDRGATQRAR